MKTIFGKMGLALVLAAALGAAGCATAPYGGGRNYHGGYAYARDSRQPVRCHDCGVVQSVQQVYTDGSRGNGGTLGAIIGAVAGGVLGNQVGKGDGRRAATVAGAVAGGFAGNAVGRRNDAARPAWRIVVRLDNGQYATVTQRDDPGVRNGDYVQVRDGLVYPE